MKKLIFFLALLSALEVKAQSQKQTDSLFAVLKTAKEDTGKVKLLAKYAFLMEQTSRDTMIYYLRKALTLSKKTDFKKATAKISGWIANYHESYNTTDSAIFYRLNQLKIAKEINDSLLIGTSYNSLSYLERMKFAFTPEANLDKALIYLDSAISFAGNRKDILIEAFSRKAEIFTERKMFTEARYFIQQAINLSPKEDIGLSINMANILSETGRADSALIIYRSIMERNKSKPFLDARWQSYLYAVTAKAYMKLKDYDLAVQNGETGLKLALDNHLSKERLDNLDMLYEIFYAKKDFENALRYFKLHRAFSDSLNTATLNSTAARFESQLMAEKNQQQIIFLEKENEKEKLVRNGFVGGFAVVLLFAGIFFRQRNKTKKEKKRSEDLLLNILPLEVAEELKRTGASKAKAFTLVTVMLTDFKDFTSVSEKVSAELLVDEINTCFSAFDNILQKYKIEKIKTIGDAYLCASGLPVSNYTHPVDMINAAFEISNYMMQRKKEKEARGEIPFELRIGIHTGPVVAGIVGVKKFAYDIWGDTVNMAARMEQNGEAGKINISGSTYQLIKDKFTCTHRGKIAAKNKGEVDMYFVES